MVRRLCGLPRAAKAGGANAPRTSHLRPPSPACLHGRLRPSASSSPAPMAPDAPETTEAGR